MHVLICGAGVIGTSTAYFLSRRGVAVTVIEAAGVACAASGKSGGFLALDWCDGTPLQGLARRSFALHAELARDVGADWGYRRLDAYSGYGAARAAATGRGDGHQPAWLADRVTVDRQLGTTRTTAQVVPAAFTTAMMRAAEARGARLHRGRVTGLLRARDGARVEGAEVDGTTAIEGDAVVIAMGPWSILAAGWMRLPGVYGLKGHSLVFDTALPAEAAFLEYREATGDHSSPEVYPRPDGTTYVCAISSESRLPRDPDAVAPDPGAIERLQAICGQIVPALVQAKIVARQACFRPVTEDGLPLIGAVPGIAGAYVATGHSVWGMLNAPATGEAVAELIVDGGARRVDLSPFDPARLRPFDPARLRMPAGH
ncbi:MAG: FAD-binding oxidoreductase [Alphaproteobacteria bacterium]|nr:FAD-binding oxidoreductase [Alphaproteobacteria bacterium]